MPGLRLVEGDVLDLELDALVSDPWQLVANLPYHITSPVLHRVLDGEPRPVSMALMLQREVAERIASPPGGMSYLSVFVQYHAAVTVANPTQATLPAGWGGTGAEDPVTFEPTLPPDRTFASVLAGVDEIVFTTFKPGFFYIDEYFDVSVDNIAVTFVPEPASLSALLGATLLLARRRRHR